MSPKHWHIPAYSGPTSRKIRKRVDENPKRGASAVRFAHYRTGMTVLEYVQACETSGKRNYALFDITWDTDPSRRLIELYD